MKILVAGSRELDPEFYVSMAWGLGDEIWQTFLWKDVSEHKEYVTGAAQGIDQIPFFFEEEYGDIVHKFPADWGKHGKAAGYIRNKEMAEFCDAAVIIWDGKSKGTRHMINLMLDSGKPLCLYVVPRNRGETAYQLEETP